MCFVFIKTALVFLLPLQASCDPLWWQTSSRTRTGMTHSTSLGSRQLVWWRGRQYEQLAVYMIAFYDLVPCTVRQQLCSTSLSGMCMVPTLVLARMPV